MPCAQLGTVCKCLEDGGDYLEVKKCEAGAPNDRLLGTSSNGGAMQNQSSSLAPNHHQREHV